MSNTMSWLLFATVVVAVVALVEGLYLLVTNLRGDEHLTERLAPISGRTIEGLMRERPNADASPWFARLLSIRLVQRLDNVVITSGIPIQTRTLVLSCGFAFVGMAFVLNAFDLNLLWAMIAAATLAFLVPIWFFLRARRRRLARIVEQLPDALDILVRSLRAGHPVSTAIGLVATDMRDPIGTEFGLVYDEMNYGLGLRDALEKMSHRLRLGDIDYMIVAMRIQSETGGSLAEVLTSLASVMRERQNLIAKAKALSAEAVLSAKILAVLPLAIFGLITILNPHYFAALTTDTTLMTLMGIAAALLIVGWVLLMKIAHIQP